MNFSVHKTFKKPYNSDKYQVSYTFGKQYH